MLDLLQATPPLQRINTRQQSHDTMSGDFVEVLRSLKFGDTSSQTEDSISSDSMKLYQSSLRPTCPPTQFRYPVEVLSTQVLLNTSKIKDHGHISNTTSMAFLEALVRRAYFGVSTAAIETKCQAMPQLALSATQPGHRPPEVAEGDWMIQQN